MMRGLSIAGVGLALLGLLMLASSQVLESLYKMLVHVIADFVETSKVDLFYVDLWWRWNASFSRLPAHLWWVMGLAFLCGGLSLMVWSWRGGLGKGR